LLRHGPKDAFLPAAGSVFILADQTRGDGLFVYVQAATIAMHSHGDPPLPLAKTPALEESPLRTLRMEVSLCGSYGVQLNLFCGFNETTPLPLSELDRTVANPIVRSLATIFILRCDRDTGHADLFSTVTNVTRGWKLGMVCV
jgi:hypothetical protein